MTKLRPFTSDDTQKEADYIVYKINIGFIQIPDFGIQPKYIISPRMKEKFKIFLQKVEFRLQIFTNKYMCIYT